MTGITPEMVNALIPVIGLAVLALVLLAVSLLKNQALNHSLSWITAAGAMVVAVVTIIAGKPSVPTLLWGGMIRFDEPAFLFGLVFLAGLALTALFASMERMLDHKPEYYLLLVFSTIGLILMVSSANLIMLYLSLETASIPLYVLAGIKYRDSRSVESGIKYFLFGSISSAIVLFGFSLLYGFGGSASLMAIREGMQTNSVPLAAVILASLFVLAGFAFKISAFPFHFWAPDVYEGVPTSVAGFLSTVSKAAGFLALTRVLIHIFGIETSSTWMILLAAMAVASMFIGNLLAIPQKNLKRLIAYSSIAQAGYVLIGVASGTEFGFTGVAYYLVAYLVTNLAVFAIIAWVERSAGSGDLQAFEGLSRRAPGIALLMMVALLSLGGIPPFGGFFAKLLVFGAAIESGMVWLAIVGIINSVIGLYYYLRIMKLMYLSEPVKEFTYKRLPVLWQVALGICIIGIIVLGVVYIPWYSLAVSVGGGL